MKKRKQTVEPTAESSTEEPAISADGGEIPPSDSAEDAAGERAVSAPEPDLEVAEDDGASVSSEADAVSADASLAAEDEADPTGTDGNDPAVSDGADDVASAEGDVAEAVADGAPDATDEEAALPPDESRLESILESLLFATDRALAVADFKRLLGERDPKRITVALEAVRERRSESGIQLVSVAGGWQLRTHPANGNWVAKLVAGRPQRLSRAMMETLAIVAYRQPITRPEIDEIRGVDCGPVLRTLLDRGLIRVIGKKEEVGRPILYGTTPEFLKTFSLRDLTELPTLREFHELGAAERAEVDAAAPAPGGTGGAAGTAAAPFDAGGLRPSTVELPNVDPQEEEALLDELEQATQAASRVTAAPIDPDADAAAEAARPVTGEG